MIEYHKNNEIDRAQWDNCIRKTHRAKPYGFSWYLDIMAPGWEALIDDEYESVFPVPLFSKFGIKYVATPPFLQQLGAFSPDKPADSALVEFLDFMPDTYKFIDICVSQEICVPGFKVTPMVNCELDLSKPYEKLWDKFSPACRHSIESAGKKKHDIISDIKPDELIDLYLRNKDRKKDKIKPADIQRLICLMNFCIKNKKGRLLGVRSMRKKLMAGIFIVETHGIKTILLNACSKETTAHNLSYYVVNETISKYSSTRTILDFASSSFTGNIPLDGSFGCVEVPYYRIYCNRLLWPARMVR